MDGWFGVQEMFSDFSIFLKLLDFYWLLVKSTGSTTNGSVWLKGLNTTQIKYLKRKVKYFSIDSSLKSQIRSTLIECCKTNV